MEIPMIRSWIVAVLAVISLWVAPLLRADPDPPVTYTRFLVPFRHTPLPGAFGSLWAVDTWFHYSGTEPILFVPAPYCRSGSGLCLSTVDVDVFGVALPVDNFGDGPVLFHVDSRYAAQLTFASKIRDLSRHEQSAGTEIPVIREDRMSAAPLYLLNVPVEPGFRDMLRIYALPEVDDPEVEVSYYERLDEFYVDNASHVPLRTERVRLRTFAPIGEHRLDPSLAEISGIEALPEIAGKNALWIEVKPITPGLRIWAFVSITNNTTQQVTLVTPGGR
jgi:hypothetical protein